MAVKVHESDYTRAVDATLQRFGVRAEIVRTGETHGFPDKTDAPGTRKLRHDTYRATFTRTEGHRAHVRPFIVPTFYQSAAHSESALECNARPAYTCRLAGGHVKHCPRAAAQSPAAYDILSAVTLYEPGSFSEWCADMGADEDSRKALTMYLAVSEEWAGVRSFFSEAELNELREVAQ